MATNLLFSLFSLLPFVIFIGMIIFVVRMVRRMERRADERLKLDKEIALSQQQQMQAIGALNQRLTNIENLLKEVE